MKDDWYDELEDNKYREVLNIQSQIEAINNEIAFLQVKMLTHKNEIFNRKVNFKLKLFYKCFIIFKQVNNSSFRKIRNNSRRDTRYEKSIKMRIDLFFIRDHTHPDASWILSMDRDSIGAIINPIMKRMPLSIQESVFN